MTLENRVVEFLNKNKEFTVATGTYIAGSTVDYLFTAAGLMNGVIPELNPIYNQMISKFGVYYGLLIPKMLICGGVIAACKYANDRPPNKNTNIRFKSKYLLYPGALLTSVVGASWYLDKWLF